MNDDNTERALVFFHRPDEGAQRQAAAGILVFRVKLEDAAKTIAGPELMNFSTFAPDFVAASPNYDTAKPSPEALKTFSRTMQDLSSGGHLNSAICHFGPASSAECPKEQCR